MKNKIIASVWLLAGIVLSSCSRTQLLRSTFENDAVGSQPNLELPGDPVGDQMQYQDVIAPGYGFKIQLLLAKKRCIFLKYELVRLYFYGNGNIKSVSDIATDAGTTNEKPIDLKKAHAVFVEIDLRTKKYDLNIVTADNTINLRTQPLATLSGTMQAYPIPFNPKIAFRLDQGVSDYRKYILESVEISQEN